MKGNNSIMNHTAQDLVKNKQANSLIRKQKQGKELSK